MNCVEKIGTQIPTMKPLNAESKDAAEETKQ